MGKNSGPNNVGSADRSDALRRASSQLAKAQEGLEAARMPIKEAKAAVKAVGVDGDIFRLFHGIRHLEEDDQRRRRLDMIDVCRDALLSDVMTADMFQGAAKAALPPSAVQSLRDTSDMLAEDEAALADGDTEERIGEAAGQTEELDADFGDPLVEADDNQLDGAGHAFNAGRDAGRKGEDADFNPYTNDDPLSELWARGRLKGAKERDAAATRFDAIHAETGLVLLDRGEPVVSIGAGYGIEYIEALAEILNAENANADLDDGAIVRRCRDLLSAAKVESWIFASGRFSDDASPMVQDTKAQHQMLTASGIDVTGIMVPSAPKRGKPSAALLAQAEEVGRAYQEAGADRNGDHPEGWTPLMIDAYRRGWDAAASSSAGSPAETSETMTDDGEGVVVDQEIIEEEPLPAFTVVEGGKRSPSAGHIDLATAV